MRFSSGRTRSRSQPGIRPSVSSTTRHLDPERGVHRRHLEADDAAADRPAALRQVEFERAGRVDDARVVGQARQRASDSEPAAMMHCVEAITRAAVAAVVDLAGACGDANLRGAADHRDLALLRQRVEPAGQPRDDLVLPVAQLAPRRSSARRTRCRARAISRASSMTRAACSSAFDGMQPTFRHTPPSVGQRSTSVTLRPRSAARNAAV